MDIALLGQKQNKRERTKEKSQNARIISKNRVKQQHLPIPGSSEGLDRQTKIPNPV